MRCVVITGVSTGIGRHAAEGLVARGYHVFGSVRKVADGEQVKADLGEGFTPLLFDVTDGEAIGEAAGLVAERVGEAGLAGLVNNAGVAIPGPLLELPIADFRFQIEVNLVGALAVTQAFLPLLGAQEGWKGVPGRVVNISSVSGQVAYPFFGPYAASKHGLEAISHSLRRELIPYGIDVIIIGPGSVRTPIWDKAAQLDITPSENSPYFKILKGLQKDSVRRGQNGLSPEVVTNAIIEALEKSRPKVRYALPSNLFKGWLLPRYLPSRWFDKLVASRMGLERKT